MRITEQEWARDEVVASPGRLPGRPADDRSTRDGDPARGRSRIAGDAARAVLERIPQGVVVLDAGGRVDSCNTRFARLVGVPSDLIAGATLDGYLTPRSAFAFRGLRLAAHESDRAAELQLRHVDGSLVAVGCTILTLADGVTGDRGVAVVFTDRRGEHTSDALHVAQVDRLAHEVGRRRAAERRLDRMLVAGAVASWECDLGSGRVIHAIGMDRVFGRRAHGPWSMQAVVAAFEPSEREALLRAFAEARFAGVLDVEGDVTTPEGARRRVRIEGRLADGGNPDGATSNGVAHLVALVRDVTVEHATRARLDRVVDDAAMRCATASIGHDLNNFLQVIGIHLESLLHKAGGDPGIARHADAAHQMLLRAAHLSTQLLRRAGDPAARPQRLVLGELLSSFRTLFVRALPASVTLGVELEDGVAPCSADRYQFEAALLNLVVNARDAMPDGGRITIRAADHRIDRHTAAAHRVDEREYVRVTVSDTGAGMPPEIATRVFEAFFTTKAPGKGTGLGLSQVDAFARGAGGFATLSSRPGEGTCVALFLPRDDRCGTRLDASVGA